MNALRVYVAAPWADASFVAAEVHEHLREIGCESTSSWAETAKGAEELDAEIAHAAIKRNDNDLLCSHVVLALPRRAAGGEMFCEVRTALVWGKRVVCVVGERDFLTAWRRGVTRVRTLGDAYAELRRMVVERNAPAAISEVVAAEMGRIRGEKKTG